MNNLIVIFILLMLQSCKGKIVVSLVKNNAITSPAPDSPPSTSSLTFPFSKLTILSGDTLTFTTTNGIGPYTANTYGIGTFNSGATSITAPDSLAPYTFNVSVSDVNGLSANMPVEIIGLNEQFLLDQTKGFGDQNYPMSIAQTTNGALYASSVVGQAAGWEAWATWKSTDNGVNWSIVDNYLMYAYGESHPMQIATKGNDVYVCGYVWGISPTPSIGNSEWLVRKSSDGGVTWQNSDHWWGSLNDNICYSIAISSSGDIFTSGYSNNTDSFVRMSADNGTTWQQIGSFPGAGVASNISVSPDGNLWVLISNNLYKGDYSLGAWNWSGPYSVTASTLGYVAYQKLGDLLVVSDTHAYVTGKVGSLWKVYESTDAGLTWSEIHSRSGEGVSIKVLSTGEILSNGNRFISFSEEYNQVIKSVDGGSTFNLVMQTGAVGLQEEGGYLIELLNGDVLSLGKRDSDSQMLVYRSTDKGDTWAQTSIIAYFDRLYSRVTDYAEDSLGNIYTAGWIYNVDPLDPSEPYIIMKSSNNGSTWSQSDYVKESTIDHSSDQVEVNILNNVFAIDSSGTANQSQLRMSTNQGASWSTIDTGIIEYDILEDDSLGNIYYMSALNLRRSSPTGTGVATVFTFPINGGQTSFKVNELKGFIDGSLMLGVYAVEAAVGYKILYRSTDQGASWTELYRTPGNSWENFKIQESPNGDFVMLINGKLYKSTNNGVAWTEIYDASLGDAESFVLSTDSRIFFVTGSHIYNYSNNTSSWNLFWNINTVILPDLDSEITRLFNCRFSSIGVCANVIDYTKNEGSANYMWAAE